MRNSFIFILKIFIIANIFNEIFCGDKSVPSENKTIKNANLAEKKREVGSSSKTVGKVQKVPNKMVKAPKSSIGQETENKNPKTATDITPEEKVPNQISKKSSNELEKSNNNKAEEIKMGKKPLELMPCYRGISKHLKSNKKLTTTKETESQKQQKNVPKTNGKNLLEGKARAETSRNSRLKIGQNLSKSADFEDNISSQNKALTRQPSKSTDLEEYMQKYEQIQKNRKKLERMEKAKLKKAMAQKAALERREKMRNPKIVSREPQGKKPIQMRQQTQQPNKALRSKNMSASTSKQSDDRRLKTGSNGRRNGKQINQAIKSDQKQKVPTVNEAENETKSEPLENDQKEGEGEEEEEDAANTYLRNLHLNLQKIPTTRNKRLHEIITTSVEQYASIRDLFVECMQKIMRTATKDHGAVQRINQFKMDIEKAMENLKSLGEDVDLAPIQLFSTREWLFSMKKDIEYMLRSLRGRHNLLITAAEAH